MASSQTSPEIRLLLVEDVPQVSQYIRNLLAVQTQVKLLDTITDGGAVVDQIQELGPQVVIVDALLQGRVNGLKVVQAVRQAGIDLPVIALTVPEKPVAVGAGLGIVRVLTMPFSGFELMNVLQEVHAEHRARSPESLSRVFAIYGAKGGVGTTTLAYNLAVAVARQGPYRVALLDGSVQFGDLRTLLRVPEDAPSILDLPTDRIEQSHIDEVVHRDPAGIEILLAPPRVEMAEMVSPRDVEKVVSVLRDAYNVVIIDTPTSVNDMLLALLDASDQIVQLLTWEHTTLHQARAMSQAFQAIGYPPAKLSYLLNRADATGGLSRDTIVEYIGRGPDHQVVSDGRLVLEANNRGKAFVSVAPDAPISQDVLRVAQALLAGATPPAVAGRRS